VRMVTHYHVGPADIDDTLRAVQRTMRSKATTAPLSGAPES